MVKLQEKELGIIQKYCGQEYVQRYQSLLNRNSENYVRIVNTGMVSSGKSSLFNVLVDSLEEEHFPTGAARTTTIADYYDYKNISFIDTPGIDVRTEDDDLAFRTIMEADIILMIHNIRTGPINRSEAEWLERIVAGMNDIEMRKKRLIFICTWKDTREKDEDYQDILDNVKRNVFELVGTEIPFFDVSVKKYSIGAKAEKEVLKNNSGIPALRDYLTNYSADYLGLKYSMDQAELCQLVQEIEDILDNERVNRMKEITKIENKVKDKYVSRSNTWRQVFNYFSNQRNQLTSLENELRNI